MAKKMTKPDVELKIRNTFIVLCACLFIVSASAIRFAEWWIVPADVWLMWVSGLSLLGTMVTGVIAAVAHCAYLDSKRSN